ncbi:tautomerase family protein [Lichenifustis flavocetrariae]|uniref:Tautomerase family protein n=1 Tax=Lichenifustis flavocetrariae TaxID=2949735 RepID=A0AA41Z285_9HYPH|nr:tautomerase family protein [Lichenifustis flavocetrariae]MCW6511518.1 tautomerase family protein [Lichenifustis flavocetrariae]
MPLVRIDLPAGKPAPYRAALMETVQSAMHAAFGVPLEERFQVVSEHGPGTLSIDPGYLGIERSSEAIIVQVTLNSGRDTATKRRLYRTLADSLHERIGLRRQDVVINFVEVERQDWSFGEGEAQLVKPDDPAA